MTLDEERFSIFVSIVSAHPGITQKGMARKSGFHPANVEVICFRAVEAGLLVCFRGRYFAVPQRDPFFVDSKKDPQFTEPKPLSILPVPTIESLESWNIFYARLEDQYEVSRAEFEASPKKIQFMVKDAMQAYAIFEWNRTAEALLYTRTPENFKLIGDWLNANRAPVTVNNLSQAFRYLAADGTLQTKNPQDAVQTESVRNTKGGIWIN